MKRTLFPFTPLEPPAVYRCPVCDRWRHVSAQYAAVMPFVRDTPSTYPKFCRSCLGVGAENPEEAATGPDV